MWVWEWVWGGAEHKQEGCLRVLPKIYPVHLKYLWQTWRSSVRGGKCRAPPRPGRTESTLSSSSSVFHGGNFRVESTQTLSKVQWSMLAPRLLHKAPRAPAGLTSDEHTRIGWKQKVSPVVSQSCLVSLDSWTRSADPTVWLLLLRRGKPN